MDTYVVMISMGGIMALISGVALLTFHDDLRKFFRFRMLKMRRSRRQNVGKYTTYDGLSSLVNEKGDSFYLNEREGKANAHHELSEENGVV
ncbi:MAG TPA: hypothetical protein VNZ86_09220 [Bacteroidia bacterium]|jgi:hypothetical protein|nr:hypothetical protein [Bacteroidia bacterium]